MREYMFGVGRGHLGADVERRAKELGADLVNHTDPGCECGHGCASDCPQRRRHWFTVPEMGDGERLARAAMAALRADRLLPEGE